MNDSRTTLFCCLGVLAFALVLLNACEEALDEIPPLPALVKEGVFLDSAVEGVSYRSGGQTGVTDSSGRFLYEENRSFFLPPSLSVPLMR